MADDLPGKPGRPLKKRKDPTMRYIAKRNLWDAVALQCGITASAVRAWQRVPSERVRSVEAAIGRRRGRIRPDLFRRTAKIDEEDNNITAEGETNGQESEREHEHPCE